MAFNLFGKKEDEAPESIFTDRTYMSVSAKTNACIALAKQQPGTLFICWFNETLKKLNRHSFSRYYCNLNRIIPVLC